MYESIYLYYFEIRLCLDSDPDREGRKVYIKLYEELMCDWTNSISSLNLCP